MTFQLSCCIIDKKRMEQQSALSNYGSSLASLVTFSVFAGIAWVCKNKCKHSKFAIDSGCFKFSADDETRRSTIREEILLELRAEGLLPNRLPVVGETEL